ncbi:hypothetical protein BV25DRAFT_186816 [Artomyces pyxidatus]|uniref:Uncharacterized protein n=1 Tax=Artomyces pyxidatus TaxID=48021 RepID=A0ACB8T8B8_9AGAM|nr:hypothetical protein BV25DRAFT_186816 [Artomyces pyxidatus]
MRPVMRLEGIKACSSSEVMRDDRYLGRLIDSLAIILARTPKDPTFAVALLIGGARDPSNKRPSLTLFLATTGPVPIVAREHMHDIWTRLADLKVALDSADSENIERVGSDIHNKIYGGHVQDLPFTTEDCDSLVELRVQLRRVDAILSDETTSLQAKVAEIKPIMVDIQKHRASILRDVTSLFKTGEDIFDRVAKFTAFPLQKYLSALLSIKDACHAIAHIPSSLHSSLFSPARSKSSASPRSYGLLGVVKRTDARS